MPDLRFPINQGDPFCDLLFLLLPPGRALLAARLCLLGNRLTLISLLAILLIVVVEVIILKKQKKTLKFSLIAIFCTFLITLLTMSGIRFWLSQGYFSKAQQLAQANLGQETVQQLEKTVNLNPLNDSYRLSLAQASLSLANQEAQKENPDQKKVGHLIQRVIEEGKIATILNPQKTENWLGLGNIYRFLSGVSGANDWAIKCYQKASGLQPDNPQIHELIAAVYYSQGKIAETKAALETALSLSEKGSKDFRRIENELEKVR